MAIVPLQTSRIALRKRKKHKMYRGKFPRSEQRKQPDDFVCFLMRACSVSKSLYGCIVDRMNITKILI